MKNKFFQFLELYYTFAKIGTFTFGGGLAMMPIMQRELVEKRGWITEEELINYNTNKDYKIKYIITSSLKEHVYNPKDLEANGDKKEFKEANNKNYTDKKEFINSLIYSNIQKPLFKL